MATAEFSASVGAVTASAAGSSGQAGDAALILAADTAAGLSVTAVGLVDTDVDATVAGAPSTTAVAAAVGVLVADGATPTQAHVNTLNTAWGTLLTAIGALNTLCLAAQTASDLAVTSLAATKVATAAAVVGGTLTSDVVVYIGSIANVADMNKFRNALRAIEDAVSGSGILATGSGTPRSPRPNR